ncbi:MAG: aldo/keto reductase [Oscillospiraceae bacterium]|jgi:predicted aldo/keto reductase-like oxidoreductase|nr:aldo/keto reductase [Oscillospiraceae bacterium]
MIYKQMGSTGKKVSAVGFGAMRFPKEEYDKDLDICAELVVKAVGMGINYIDTAPGYCEDKSELIVGRALSQMKEKPYISTKCGLWNANRASSARHRIEQSLKALGTDKITFYNMWCIKNMDEYQQMTRKDGNFYGILKAKEERLVEHICCTVHADGETISKIIADGKVDVVTLGYNALNFAYRREGVKACYEKGLGVVVMNPLGGGVIPQYAGKFSFLKTSPEETVATAALKFLIGHPEISVTLPGISNLRELEECVAAAGNVTPVTEERLAEMSKLLGKELDTLCTGCQYCDECPEGVPIPQLLDAYNGYILSGDKKEVKQRLGMHWGLSPDTAAACTQCGRCEPLCTQKLPIIERLAEICS